jgi:adenylate cyclase
MKEIERKFLLQTDEWKNAPIKGRVEMKQAYLFKEQKQSLRIRLAANRAFLTIKLGQGLTRSEFEYEIPYEEAQALIEEAKLPCLHKTRHYVQAGADEWEVDVFHGALEGLVIAEMELEEETQALALPNWIGPEVTDDPAYLNANLIDRL